MEQVIRFPNTSNNSGLDRVQDDSLQMFHFLHTVPQIIPYTGATRAVKIFLPKLLNRFVCYHVLGMYKLAYLTECKLTDIFVEIRKLIIRGKFLCRLKTQGTVGVYGLAFERGVRREYWINITPYVVRNKSSQIDTPM